MEQQIDPMTGMPTASPQQQVPANMQGGRPQNFITQSQQQVGQNIFGGQSLSREYGVNTPQAPQAPLYKMDPNYNGKPGVQKEDFEQF